MSKQLSKEILEYEYKKYGSMQKVANSLNLSVDTIYKYIKLYNIPYKVSNHKCIYSCNENIFKTDTEESFYIAGFIAADGSLQKRKYSKILKICLSKNDIDHLEKIKNIFDSTHPIKEYIIKPNKLVKTINKCVEIQIANNHIYDDLNKFNIVPNKTFIYNIPEWLSNHKLINHFMRGYFDGDGSISNCGLGINRKVIQKSFNILGTESFISQYKELLKLNCNVNDNKIIKINNIYSLSYSGNNVIKRIYEFLYKDATIYLDRKKDKFIQSS